MSEKHCIIPGTIFKFIYIYIERERERERERDRESLYINSYIRSLNLKYIYQ